MAVGAGGEALAAEPEERVDLFVGGLPTYGHATLRQKIFDIAKAEAGRRE